jgi:hypothetical protein
MHRSRQIDDAFSDDYASTQLADVRVEAIAFCEQQLEDHQPRDGYRELLQLTLTFLGKSSSDKVRSPSPMHQACWMAKAIYSIKVWLFSGPSSS